MLKKFIYAKRNKNPKVTCWGTGKPMREFLHVDDLADACIHVLEKWDPDDQSSPKDENGDSLFYLNVGSGQELSIIELANLIAKLTNYEGKIFWDKSKPDGTYRKNLDISRIKSLGWKPNLDLSNGLKKLIENIENALDAESEESFPLKNFRM